MPDKYESIKQALVSRFRPLSGLASQPVSIGPASPDDYQPNMVAHTRGTSVSIDKPSWVDSGVMAHELTHVWQNTRNNDFKQAQPNAGYNGWSNDDYEYGGVDGLEQALKNRKTIADFSREQLGAMVRDYVNATNSVMTAKGLSPQQAQQYDRMKAAYEPFLQQMSSVPDGEGGPGTMPTPVNTPAAPPSSVTGIASSGMILGAFRQVGR